MYTSSTQWTTAPRPDSGGQTLFAIGDIHGHADELVAIRRVIQEQVEALQPVLATTVYLGDYIDRGPAIVKTLDFLADAAAIDGPLSNTDAQASQSAFLVGNHDQCLIELLDGSNDLDRAFLTSWLDNGGDKTLSQLGVDGYGRLIMAGDFAELQHRTTTAVGPRRRALLDSLRPSMRIGDYVFAHAGIDPDRSMDDQDFADLLMIRRPFLEAADRWDHPFCVVHGHSIAMPSVHPHRIGVDAGCYRNGALCAVQIHEGRLRFIGVSADPSYPWNEKLGANGVWQWPKARHVPG